MSYERKCGPGSFDQPRYFGFLTSVIVANRLTKNLSVPFSAFSTLNPHQLPQRSLIKLDFLFNLSKQISKPISLARQEGFEPSTTQPCRGCFLPVELLEYGYIELADFYTADINLWNWLDIRSSTDKICMEQVTRIELASCGRKPHILSIKLHLHSCDYLTPSKVILMFSPYLGATPFFENFPYTSAAPYA